ncbi:MAG: nitroreductase family protein, partial [Bacteroides sp.]|nr:nitroreductase family protein [Bacteroides sp.]
NHQPPLTNKTLPRLKTQAGAPPLPPPAAPTSMNFQPWHFIVVDDALLIDKLSKQLPYAKMLKEAGLGIVVCGDVSLYDKVNAMTGEDNTLYWVQDCSAATENLLLAAHALGLGAVWTGIFPLESRVSLLKELLKLSENLVPLNIIVVGNPVSLSDKGKDKWKTERISYNQL